MYRKNDVILKICDHILRIVFLGSRLPVSNSDVRNGIRNPFEFNFQGTSADSYFLITFTGEFRQNTKPINDIIGSHAPSRHSGT